MTFIYPWLFFLFIPLYIFYKTEPQSIDTSKIRQRKLLYLSLSFILIALTRPVISNTINNQKFDAQDYIIAIDASYSMQADDLKPTRYEVAKQNIQELLHKLPKDRFSIFAFTSNAMLISPPTTDTEISMMALDVLNPKFILTKGTSIYELLKTISKTFYDKKNLIIFSDGGEDHNLARLLSMAKKSNIIPYIVATGSQDGAILKNDDFNIKDENNNLVISRINPILKDFALGSGGKYYELDSDSNAVVTDLISELGSSSQKNEQTNIQVLSFTELFYAPLLLAIFFFFIAVTKIHQLYLLFLPFLFLPNSSHAVLLDFYHLDKANKHYHEKQYLNSAQEFEKITPSVESYYNLGVSYYKAKHYKKAIEVFSKIKSTDSTLKQKLFYNMGNCAVELKKYDRAKIYYSQALALGFDEDSFYNLSLLYKLSLKEKIDVSAMMPKKDSHKSIKDSQQSNTTKDESKSSSSKSNQKAGESSAGSSSAENKKEYQEKLEKSDKINKSQYKIGYKAYELINKGYTNEKHPW
ncbi:Ca-activated chloride channel family protein [Epsilonproteobacteria bacterium SCGC AD-308-O04]|nr:Ca-activated chloride channel family protein [Epsilonproteobacteria bacterium SCGC AD-308-O04]